MAAVASSASFILFKKSSPFQPHPSLPSSLSFSSSFSSYSSLSISHTRDSPSLLLLPTTLKSLSKTLALLREDPASTAEFSEKENGDDPSLRAVPCELYVCNIPRSSDISELFVIFQRFGTVRSVEISRNSETGISRGCGYVIMSSIDEAKSAVAALDGFDLGGREVRVRFSADVFSRRKNVDALNSAPKSVCFESPYKAYVGNLAWSVRPEDLRERFCQFGYVVSTRVLYDRKGGKNRVYGFISFSSSKELKAALSSNGMVIIFCLCNFTPIFLE
eukprot:TRINITY_DN48020_c0_g1_i1.p1 TRINITY_DN48020_c0_g1~~TRINITY_DN48020_c0_g1_i1.p1  ORF type:complete len:276 (+),score=48.71 TRINITY_DN48020_c0_g1_i1:117-944(+)